MITETSMYWITRLDPINNFVEGFSALTCVMFIIMAVAALVTSIHYLVKRTIALW